VVLVGLGCLGGLLVITENMLMMMLALNFGFGAYLLMKIDSKNADLGRLKIDIQKGLDDIQLPTFNFDAIKDEMLDLIEDLMSNMRVPTAIDHAAGFFSQFMQLKAQKQMAEMGLIQSDDPGIEPDND